jgi:hypothetical protein
MDPHIQFLLKLLGENSPAAARPQDPSWDWCRFQEACTFHEITPLVLGRLRALGGCGAPSALLDSLGARFYQVSAYNVRLAERLVRLCSLLEDEGIPVLAYKGPALAIAAYGNLALREFADLDLVVPAHQIPRSVLALSAEGYRIAPDSYLPDTPRDLRNYHAVTLEAPDGLCRVDLHWALAKDYARAFSPDVPILFERRQEVKLPSGTVPVLCREDLFLGLCFHGTKHRWQRLKWLCDIDALLRRAESMDWDYIARVIRAAPRMAAACALALLLADRLLGSPVPARIAARMSPSGRTSRTAAAICTELSTQGRTTGSDHETFLGLEERWLSRLKYLAVQAWRYPVASLFTEVSARDRAFARVPRFLYYIVRPTRLAVQHGPRVMRWLWAFARR